MLDDENNDGYVGDNHQTWPTRICGTTYVFDGF